MFLCKLRTANIFVSFQVNVNFLDRISKHNQNSSFVKIPSVGADGLVWTNRHDEANNCFSQFCKSA